MKVLRWGIGAIAALLFAGSTVCADEIEDMKKALSEMQEQMREVNQQLAQERASKTANAGGAPESLVGKAKKGTIKIGGKFSTVYAWHAVEDQLGNEDGRSINSGWGTDDAEIKFHISFNKDVSAVVKLDLDDGNLTADGFNGGDLVEEAYWHWKNIACTGAFVQVGKFEVPYGMDDAGSASISSAFTHRSSQAGVAGNGEDDFNDSFIFGINSATPNNPYDSGPAEGATGDNLLPATGYINSGIVGQGELDNRYGAIVGYKYEDLAKLELCVFDESNGTYDEGKAPIDNGFQSFCGRLTITPVEALEVEMSAIRRYRRGEKAAEVGDYQDSPLGTHPRFFYITSNGTQVNDGNANPRHGYWDDRNQTNAIYAASMGMSYDFSKNPCTKLPLRVFGEYIRTWNNNWNKSMYSNTISAGLDIFATEKLTMTTRYDYNGNQLPFYSDSNNNEPSGNYFARQTGFTEATGIATFAVIDEEHTHRAMFATKYDFGNGLYIAFEYAHVWLYQKGSEWTYQYGTTTLNNGTQEFTGYIRTGNDNSWSETRHKDTFAFKTGFKF